MTTKTKKTTESARKTAGARARIDIQRAYDDPAGGYRVLVDRVWPRGRTKESLQLDDWLRDLAPGAPLRKAFGHDPARWQAFRSAYLKELAAGDQQARMLSLLESAGGERIVLVYGARDTEHNQAVVLREALLALAPRPAAGRVARAG